MNKIVLVGRDFYFGIGFLNELLDGTGLRIDELGSQDDATLIPKMMYYSISYACKRLGLEMDLSMPDIFDLIDDNGGIGGQFWNDFYIAFNESMYKNVPAEKESKKKVTAKK